MFEPENKTNYLFPSIIYWSIIFYCRIQVEQIKYYFEPLHQLEKNTIGYLRMRRMVGDKRSTEWLATYTWDNFCIV